jgi:hypothetical protein
MGETTPQTVPSAMIINLGRQRARRVRQLRRGRGRLMRVVQDTLAELRSANGDLEPNQPVVVVVQRRRRRRRRSLWRRSLRTRNYRRYSPVMGWLGWP